MCGRFAQHFTFSKIAETIDILAPTASNFEPRYNLGPRQKAWFIKKETTDVEMGRALFEFVPFWHRKPLREKKYSTFNAKLEGILDGTTKSFKAAWTEGRRGVLPVSGFYEWPRPKQTGQGPMYIRSKDSEVLLLGCIWSKWLDVTTEERIDTCAIITLPANEFMKGIPHHRCPLVIDPANASRWIDHHVEDVTDLLKPPPEDAFKGEFVSNYVNRIGTEGADCIANT